MFRRLTLPAASALALLFVPPVDGEETKAKPSEREEKVSLEIRTWDEVEELVKSHEGKVVVVDLWSTSCPPCVREFPRLVELHRRHGGDVACVSVNLNYAGLKDEPPESLREPVLEFLKKKDATLQNVLCSTPDIEVFDAIKLASIPAVCVYGRDGKLVKRFDNDQLKSGDDEFTYERDVLPLVRELIGKK